MRRFGSSWLVLGLVLGTPGLGASQQPDTPPPPSKGGEPTKIEVRYINGSVVFMSLVQDSIEVLTDFGKLTIPLRELRSIDFGLHIEKDTEAKVATLIQQLSNPSFRERETAVRDLIGMGAAAHSELQKASKNKDIEVAKRALVALQTIEKKVPGKLLHRKREDTIRTRKFSIVGQLSTPVLLARAEYFGDVQLKPSQLVSLRCLDSVGDSEITIDASAYGSMPDQWLDTGVVMEAQSKVTIVALGQVDLWPQQPGQYLTGPGGRSGTRHQSYSVGYSGSLLGRIGDKGAPFVIGERFSGSLPQDGTLQLHIVPSPWNNASAGNYRVHVGPAGEGD